MTDWKATLNGSTMCGGDCTGDETVDGCLMLPPDGLGVPSLRVEDLPYPQRDGVEHFADWYEPRIITLTGLIGGGGCGCDGSNDARGRARAVMSAWSRQCDDVELVLAEKCGDGLGDQILPNPSMDVNAAGWNIVFNVSALTRNTSVFRSAPASLRATVDALGGLTIKSDNVPVTPGVTYSGRFYMRSGTNVATFRMSIAYLDILGNVIGGDEHVGEYVGSSTSAWREVTVSALAPNDAVNAYVRVLSVDAAGGGTFQYFDDFALVGVGGVTNGPFGVRGRPRVAQLTWRKGKRSIADTLLRFDSSDQRLYVLDPFGTPGSGTQCVTTDDFFSGFTYDSAVDAIASIDSHCPLDLTRIIPVSGQPPGNQAADDVIGFANGLIRGGYITGDSYAEQGPPISWNLSMSAVVGPAYFQSGLTFPNPYSSGMFGWWQQTDGTSLPCGAVMVFGNGTIGVDAVGQPSPVIRWAGTNVAMNGAVQDAFGFTDTLRNQPVLIVVTWTATALNIYAGHAASGATKLLQTVAVGAFPTPTLNAPTLQIFGRVSNIMQAVNGSPDGEAITDTLTPYAFADPNGEVTIPDVGELCGPIQVTFAAPGNSTFNDIYIFKEDGTYVGFTSSGIGVDNPSSLDTDTGTALGLFDTTDFTPRITGDPFLQVSPGEKLHIFAGGGGSPPATITICFRPSVISA